MLKNKLVDTIAFLENLAVKDGVDKDVFFKKLPAALPNLPLPVVQRKLLPMLASESPSPSQALIWKYLPSSVDGRVLSMALLRLG